MFEVDDLITFHALTVKTSIVAFYQAAQDQRRKM
jgi:hypothetical protein